MKRFPGATALAQALAVFGLAACHGNDDGNGSQPSNVLLNFISGSVRTQTLTARPTTC
ncbi:MAG: hypothetical protein CBARDCOR_1186 [uncultured Caballeronia sp.]|nr:MAG: hypothetical protein CBARDCOR_1186 [uncultured Caballeronia sp.]